MILITYSISLRKTEALFEDDNVQHYRKVVIRVPVEIKHLTHTVVKVVEKPSENTGMEHKHDGEVIHHHHHGGHVDHIHKHEVEAGKSKYKNRNLGLRYAGEYDSHLTEPNYLDINYEEKDEHYNEHDRTNYRESEAKKLQYQPMNVYSVDVENYWPNVGHFSRLSDSHYFRHNNHRNNPEYEYAGKDHRKNKNVQHPFNRRYADGKNNNLQFVGEDPEQWPLDYFHSYTEPNSSFMSKPVLSSSGSVPLPLKSSAMTMTKIASLKKRKARTFKSRKSMLN